jgi:hypothetical protein
MSAAIARNILVFLERVPITGAQEHAAFNAILQVLGDIIQAEKEDAEETTE